MLRIACVMGKGKGKGKSEGVSWGVGVYGGSAIVSRRAPLLAPTRALRAGVSVPLCTPVWGIGLPIAPISWSPVTERFSTRAAYSSSPTASRNPITCTAQAATSRPLCHSSGTASCIGQSFHRKFVNFTCTLEDVHQILHILNSSTHFSRLGPNFLTNFHPYFRSYFWLEDNFADVFDKFLK